MTELERTADGKIKPPAHIVRDQQRTSDDDIAIYPIPGAGAGDLEDLERAIAVLELNSRAEAQDKRLHDFSAQMRSEIAGVRHAADEVHDAYQAELKKLYREDGQRKFSEAEHKDLEDDLKRRRDEAFSELKGLSDKLSSEIGERLEVASKPERYLSDEEMERANGRREFVREDVDRLPLGDVPGFLRDVELSGDRVEKWLASRYAAIRADRELEKLRENGGAGGNAEEVSRNLREVREGAERLSEQLQLPGTGTRKKALETLHQEAASLKNHVAAKSLTHEERVAMSSSPFR